MCWPAVHCGGMSDSVMEAKPLNPKADEWAERIAAQQRSGVSVKQFCKEQGLTEYSFYAWRKRLQQTGPVRFALVDRNPRRLSLRLVRMRNCAFWRQMGGLLAGWQLRKQLFLKDFS